MNIITKKNIEGLSGDFQPGISHYSDNKTYQGSLMWGTSLGGGNGHFVIAAEGRQGKRRRPAGGPTADPADRYVGKGNCDNTQLTAYNVNRIPSVVYVNLSLQYTTKPGGMDTLQYFVKINNLFNKYPPIDPQHFFASIQTNPMLYDTVGRMFYAGVRFKF